MVEKLNSFGNKCRQEEGRSASRLFQFLISVVSVFSMQNQRVAAYFHEENGETLTRAGNCMRITKLVIVIFK